MYIHYRPAAALFRLAVSVLAALCLAMQLAALGPAAWRLFSSWVMLFAAIYFVVLALISAFVTRRPLGDQNWPILEGGLALTSVVVAVGTLCLRSLGRPIYGVGGPGGFAIHFFVPALIILDYLLFCRKGRFKAIYPLNWLALPVIYVALILLTALNHLDTIALALPYAFLDYAELGFDNFALSLIIMAVLTLAAGYVIFLVDFAMSGKLAKHIVIPKLKAVVVEDDAPTPAPAQTKVVETKRIAVADGKPAAPRTKATSKKPASTSKKPTPTSSKPAPTSSKPAPTSKDSAQTSSEPKKASKKPATTSSEPPRPTTGEKIAKKPAQKTSSQPQPTSKTIKVTSSATQPANKAAQHTKEKPKSERPKIRKF